VQALLEMKLSAFTSARATVEQGLQVAPTHGPLYCVLGKLQDIEGDTEGARASFRKGLDLNPTYAQLYHAWARLEGKMLNWDALAELNRRAREAFPLSAGAAATGGMGIGETAAGTFPPIS